MPSNHPEGMSLSLVILGSCTGHSLFNLDAKILTYESQPIWHQYGQTYSESQAREGH